MQYLTRHLREMWSKYHFNMWVKCDVSEGQKTTLLYPKCKKCDRNCPFQNFPDITLKFSNPFSSNYSQKVGKNLTAYFLKLSVRRFSWYLVLKFPRYFRIHNYSNYLQNEGKFSTKSSILKLFWNLLQISTKFPVPISSNYSQNLDKISSKLTFIIIFLAYTWNSRLHNCFQSIFLKYWKNFLKIVCLKFPSRFLIISSEFTTPYFPRLSPKCWKNFRRIFRFKIFLKFP